MNILKSERRSGASLNRRDIWRWTSLCAAREGGWGCQPLLSKVKHKNEIHEVKVKVNKKRGNKKTTHLITPLPFPMIPTQNLQKPFISICIAALFYLLDVL